MLQLSDKQIAEYFRHSYAAVDGLWFVKVEDGYGFDSALEIDNEVWKILPKIQARMLKSMGNVGGGTKALLKCLTTKLSLEGFVFKTENIKDGFRVIIDKCVWHDMLVKAGRGHLSDKIGGLVCNTEYSVWASEFDDKIHFGLKSRICQGSGRCLLEFTR